MQRLFAAVGIVAIVGCGSVSGTDRTQLNMYSVDQEIRLGDEAYREMLAGVKTVDQGPEYRMVREVSDERLRACHIWKDQHVYIWTDRAGHIWKWRERSPMRDCAPAIYGNIR